MDRDRSVDRFLPLRPVEFHILLSLAGGASHGYAILQDLEARGERNPPDVGTLYRALRRMEDQRLINAVPDKPGDERRNRFAITTLGGKVVRAEVARMESLLRAARAGGLALGGAR